jgi:hypothetical protein
MPWTREKHERPLVSRSRSNNSQINRDINIIRGVRQPDSRSDMMERESRGRNILVRFLLGSSSHRNLDQNMIALAYARADLWPKANLEMGSFFDDPSSAYPSARLNGFGIELEHERREQRGLYADIGDIFTDL